MRFAESRFRSRFSGSRFADGRFWVGSGSCEIPDLVTLRRAFVAGEIGGYWPMDAAGIFQASDGTTAGAADAVIGYVANAIVGGPAAVQATTGNKPYLRRTPSTGKYWLDGNTGTAALVATTPSVAGLSEVARLDPITQSVVWTDETFSTTSVGIVSPFGFNSDTFVRGISVSGRLSASQKSAVERLMLRSMPVVEDDTQGIPTNKLKMWLLDGVYVDFVNDLAWVNDSVTSANCFHGAASTLLSKAYTKTADGAAITVVADRFVLPRAKHNWSATAGTVYAYAKATIAEDAALRTIASTSTRYISALDDRSGLPPQVVIKHIDSAGVARYPAREINAGQWLRIVTSWSGGVLTGAIDGQACVDEATAGVADTDMAIGARQTTSNNPLNGHIREIAYFPIPLSAGDAIKQTDVRSSVRYAVFLLAGQSNAVGRGIRSNNDGSAHAHAWQTRQWLPSGLSLGNSVDLLLDLTHPDGGRNDLMPSLGIAVQLAKDYTRGKADELLRIVFVPCATGGTGFSNGHWRVGDAGYEYAVAQTNAALAGLPGAVFHGILWQQGERDAYDGNAAYAAQLDAMIAGMRSAITGATSAPIYLGGMCPDHLDEPTDGSTIENVAAIQAVIADTPNRVSNAHYISSNDLSGDVHFNTASLLILGSRYATSILAVEAG